jgi:hypothetical protein
MKILRQVYIFYSAIFNLLYTFLGSKFLIFVAPMHHDAEAICLAKEVYTNNNKTKIVNDMLPHKNPYFKS